MNCTVCQHPERQAIDQALLAKSLTLEALSQTYGLSTSALQRHKAHLQAKVGRAKGQLQENLRQGCLLWLTQALEMSMQTAAAAQADGHHKVVLQALAQGTRLVKILLKQDLPLDDRLVYETLTSPQWTAQSGILPVAPEVLAAGRQSLSGALLSPCSDQDPPASALESPEDLDLAALQSLLGTLSQFSADPLEAANPALPSWEKSGKLPGKAAAEQINNQSKQKDKHHKKNAGKNSASPRPGAWLETLDVGRNLPLLFDKV